MTSLYHVGLTVSNLGRSMAFYRDAVGMALEYRSALANAAFDELIAIDGIQIDFCYLVRDGFRLQLIEYLHGGSDAPLALRHNKPGNPHLSFWVDDVEAKYAALERMGGIAFTSAIITQENADISARTFYVTDPDGVQVEFCQMIHDRVSGRILAD